MVQIRNNNILQNINSQLQLPDPEFDVGQASNNVQLVLDVNPLSTLTNNVVGNGTGTVDVSNSIIGYSVPKGQVLYLNAVQFGWGDASGMSGHTNPVVLHIKASVNNELMDIITLSYEEEGQLGNNQNFTSQFSRPIIVDGGTDVIFSITGATALLSLTSFCNVLGLLQTNEVYNN